MLEASRMKYNILCILRQEACFRTRVQFSAVSGTKTKNYETLFKKIEGK